MASKKMYVARGGRDLCITSDYTQALLIARNKAERVHEFGNYSGALKLFKKMVDSAIEHSEKPKGDFIHLDVSVNLNNGLAEFRVMQNDKHLISANSLGFCTPNIAEFLAIVEAYKYAQTFQLTQNIYCDNIAAVKAFKREFIMVVPPTLNAANPKIAELMEKAYDYINMLPQGYEEQVMFWDKSLWGEIPSDYKTNKNFNI
jgi:hypothetical protein